MDTTWYIPNTKQFEALHDIEAPLRAIGGVLTSLGGLPRPVRLQLHRLLGRVEGILREDAGAPRAACDLRETLVDLLFEKRAANPTARLKLAVGAHRRPRAALPALECARLLSNCIDHALGAAGGALLRIGIREHETTCGVDISFAAGAAPAASLALQLATAKAGEWGGRVSTRRRGSSETISVLLPRHAPGLSRAG